MATALFVAVSVAPVALPASAGAASPHFASCASMHRVYPRGAAKSNAAASYQVAHGYNRPASTAAARRVYAANPRMDPDHDGTACETKPATQAPAHLAGTTGTSSTGSSSGGTDPRFGTCTDAKAHGYGPYYQGRDTEYSWYEDRDSDGVVCE